MDTNNTSRHCLASRYWVSVLICAALTGCAGQLTVGEYVAPDGACCSSISEFKYRPVPLGQEIEFSFTPESPSYDFSGKRQHFIALKIPDRFAASTIQVKSYLSTSYLPRATAVSPEFVFLNTDFQVIAKSSTTGYQSAGGFWRSAVVGRTLVPANASYIVVTAGDGSNGRPIVYSENRTPYSIPPAALGDFSLRLFGEFINK